MYQFVSTVCMGRVIIFCEHTLYSVRFEGCMIGLGHRYLCKMFYMHYLPCLIPPKTCLLCSSFVKICTALTGIWTLDLWLIMQLLYQLSQGVCLQWDLLHFPRLLWDIANSWLVFVIDYSVLEHPKHCFTKIGCKVYWSRMSPQMMGKNVLPWKGFELKTSILLCWCSTNLAANRGCLIQEQMSLFFKV